MNPLLKKESLSGQPGSKHRRMAASSMSLVGAVQLLVTLVVNLSFGGVASLFSDPWWTRWFPSYVGGASMFVIGLALRQAVKRVC